MSGRVVQPAKKVSESKGYAFDFVGQLRNGDTVSTGTTTMTVYSGVDASPISMVSGSVTVSAQSICTQILVGGVAGVIYVMKMQAVTALGDILVQTAFIAVLPDQP